MTNFITGKAYQGKNLDRLDGLSKSGQFCTFLQGKQAGLKLKKGSKGIALVAYKTKTYKDKKTKKIEKQTIRNCFRVFAKENWSEDK